MGSIPSISSSLCNVCCIFFYVSLQATENSLLYLHIVIILTLTTQEHSTVIIEDKVTRQYKEKL